MTRQTVLWTHFVLAMIALPDARGAILFDNGVGSGGLISIGTGCSECSYLYAMPFQATASGRLGLIASQWWMDPGDDTYAMSLWSDDNGKPAIELESWPMPPLPVGNLPVVETALISAAMPQITAGQRYWFIVTMSTVDFGLGIGWALGTGSETLWVGPTPQSLEPFSDSYPGLRVESAVPEPHPLSLTALGACVIAMCARLSRRRQKGAPRPAADTGA